MIFATEFAAGAKIFINQVAEKYGENVLANFRMEDFGCAISAFLSNRYLVLSAR